MMSVLKPGFPASALPLPTPVDLLSVSTLDFRCLNVFKLLPVLKVAREECCNPEAGDPVDLTKEAA